MYFPVTQSQNAMVFDTLPAKKVEYFKTYSPSDNIYTYLQLYAKGSSLAISLRTFERAPSPESRISFAISGGEDGYLLFSLWPQKAALSLVNDTKAASLGPPDISRFAGEDEHGWYWGADVLFPPELLAKAGCVLQLQSTFTAAIFKGAGKTSISGFSYMPGNTPEDSILPAAFDSFIISPY